MNAFLEKLPEQLRKCIGKKSMPSFKEPMLATLTKNYFSDKDWIYERKLDGVRCLFFKNKKELNLKSRNDTLLNSTYPELIQALEHIKVNQLIMDGEIVTFDGDISSFEKLQPRLGVKNPSPELIKKVKVYLYLFDILYVDGYDISRLPLIKRKYLLKHLLTFKAPIRYVIHKNEKGLPFFKQACKKGWEGIIAKKRDSIYVYARSTDWLKFKCVQEQELVIGGYTEPQGSRIGLGSLLVGYYKGDRLMYAGKVGTGYTDELLSTLSTRLKKIETRKNPFSQVIKDIDVHFVKPKLVAEIRFEEWTKGNKLRQPRFLGLREDKDPKDVVKETPKSIVPNREN